mmetsp:Transcript_12445/g.31025  ORF Transcript_12445/g.31025 Transcript_12445/m.31025 type:complete len:584 (-) Transcript_12445:117-1868(-)
MASAFIEAVLFAEFDIDKGSVLRCQYPRPVTDDSLIAELMIPEGVHDRFQDWTIFMLNRPPLSASPVARKWPVQAYKYEGQVPDGQWKLASSDGADVTHWAQVNGKTSSEGSEAHVMVDMGRGKTIRLRGHDEEGLQYATLQPDFASMWTADGEAVGLHFRSGAQQEEFKQALDAACSSAEVLWCLNHVSSRRDTTVRRGAQVKALAVCSRFKFIHVWKPMLMLAVDRLFKTSTGLGEYSVPPVEQCRYLFETLTSLPPSLLPVASEVQRQVHRLMLAHGSARPELKEVGRMQWLDSQEIPLRVPLMLQPQELAETSLTDLFKRFKAGLFCALHALINRQRVFFLGHNQPAESVCHAVLSLPLMVCPPMQDVLHHCFPYTTLNNLDFLTVPGYIAGATNPIFESHPEWWDVLFDLDTGKVLISTIGANGKPVASDAPKLSDADSETYEQVTAGIEAHYSEYWLRASLQEYALQIICARRRGVNDLSWPDRVANHMERLRYSNPKATDSEMLKMLGDINGFIADEAQLLQFLDILPGSSPLGCLSAIATGRFHPSKDVRKLTAAVLARCPAELVNVNLSGFLRP